MLLGKGRIEALTDGIYAFALTLGVLSIDIAKINAPSGNSEMYFSLISFLPQMIYYAIAFFILVSFWMAHHRIMENVRNVDSIFNWINAAVLFFVALVPFTTDLMGYYDEYPLAIEAFAANLLIVGVLQMAGWLYITSKKELLKEGTDSKTIFEYSLRSLSCPAAAVIVIIYAHFVSPSHAAFFFLLIPVFKLLTAKAAKGKDLSKN
ncbi:MAG: TMEM175 family protein [Methanomicrobium sp.]|nr:TMEM175 family protein [Methanomicrobium sp.]